MRLAKSLESAEYCRYYSGPASSPRGCNFLDWEIQPQGIAHCPKAMAVVESNKLKAQH